MANRYIHGSLLSGENNGEDWANAYQINDLSQIPWSEIDDGDEIFIHGDGVLHYVLTNPLIYGKDVRIRCGQETGHNGQVIIDGNGLELDEVVQMDSNCSLYGFGSTHYDYYITPRGTTREISCGIRITNVKGCGINIPTETDWEVSYVQVDNIGWIDDIVVESYHGIKCRNAQGGSIHHCHIFHCGGDGVNSSGSRADNWGSNEFYYNVVHNVNDDGIAGKAGWDVHRNIIGYCSVQKGINTEHPDGMQLQGNWTRVWFNEVFNVANCCIFLDPVKGSSGFDGLGDMDGYRHVRVHNNLLYQTEESLDPPRIISRGIQLRGDGEPDQKIVDDIYVFSNDAVDFSRHGAFVDTSDSTLITTYNVVWRNNLIHNCETYQMFASGSEMDPAYGQPDMDYDYVGTDGTNGYNTMQWGNVNYSWADFVSNGFGEDNGTDVAPTFVDHAFRDTDHYDLHLDPSSPSCLTDGVDMLTEFPVLASTCPDADKDFDEVLRPVGTGWSKGCFQVLTGAAPEIDSIDPGEGGVAGGTTCTITGSNFTSSRGTEVRFDGTLASNIVVVNPTTITCNSPAHAAGAVDVQVSTSSGSDTLTDGFIYYGAPTITDVDPDNGTKNGGTSVTITGTNFTAVGQTVIVFGGVKSTGVLVVNSTTIVCTTPAHAAGTVNVVLLNAYGSDTLTDGYTFNEEEKGWGINTGTAATAGWAHLDAVEEVDKPVPISLAHDFRGPSTFVWEMRHGKHWDVPNHQKVTFEYPAGTVRFRGRFKISKGEGTPGSQGYRFDCVGMRGLARNVPVVDSAADGYPELIYNADPTDVDYHRSVFNTDGSDMTVGEIIKDLFDRFKTALDGEDATISGNAAYTQSELDSLSAVPGKMTFLETGFEAAVMQVLAVQGVTWSIWVDMSVGMWHFVDRRSILLPARTIELGTDAIEQDNISTSVDECYTALKIFGRQGAGDHAVREKIGFGEDLSGQTLSGLGKAWDETEEENWTIEKSVGEKDHGEITTIGIENAGLQHLYITQTGKDWTEDFWNGTGGSPAMGEAGTINFPAWHSQKTFEIISNTATKIVFAAGDDYSAIQSQIAADDRYTLNMRTIFSDMFRRFYITDPAKRKVMESGEYGTEDCCPRFWKTGYWTGGSFAFRIGVPVRFEPTEEEWGGSSIDVAVVTKYPIFKLAAQGAELWDYLALEYCYATQSEGVTLQVRYPSAGWIGTAAGEPYSLQREMVKIIPEFNRPELLVDFAMLAQDLLKPHQDVRVWGDVTLEGHLTDYYDPRFRLFIGHKDETIAWEAALNASVAGIRFDYQSLTTKITLSNDFKDGFNYADLLERRLGEKLAEIEAGERRKDQDYISCARGETMSHLVPPGKGEFFKYVEGNTGQAGADQEDDTLNIVGTNGLSTSASGKTLTIIPPTLPIKSIFKTISGDTGSVNASGETDEFKVEGGANITTQVLNDSGTKKVIITGVAEEAADGFGKIAVGTSTADANQPDDTVEFGVYEGQSRILITIPTSEPPQIRWALTGKKLTNIPNPLLSEFKKWVVAGHSAGLTRCDGATYNANGSWVDFNSGSGCSALGNPNQSGAASYQCRSYPDYKSPYSGSAVEMHGIVTRGGSYGGNYNPPGFIHYLFPYICKVSGYPSSTVPCCTPTEGQKDLLIVIPDDDKVEADEMTMADLIPVWLQAYANFIKFTSQGMACMDDRLYLLDANIFGYNGGPANSSCGGSGNTADMSVLEQLCNCLYTITEYFGEYCNELDTACSGDCTDCTLQAVGDHGSHRHQCKRPVSAPSAYLGSGSGRTGCEMSWKCCPSCGAGGDAECYVHA